MNFLHGRPLSTRVTAFCIFCLAVSPLLISLLIHIVVLFLSSLLTWNFGVSTTADEDLPATIILEAKKDEGLKFQGTDSLDLFKADERNVPPLPEVEYRPILPEAEFYPEPKATRALDIISIETAALDHAWVNPPAAGQPLYAGTEQLTGSFFRHIQELREGGLDVVFVFDSTASMTAYLNEVKRKIEKLVLTFKKLVPACRIGLVTYRDNLDEYVTKTHPLTYGTASLKAFLNSIEAKGGYDFEEAIDEALRVAVEEIAWNKKSRKFVLLIGDAPPHKEAMPATVAVIKKFKEEMGGIVSALDIRKPEKLSREYWESIDHRRSGDGPSEQFSYLTARQDVMDEFQVFAEVGGGESARLINEERVVKHMLLLIFGTQWEMNLDEFMRDL